MDILFGEDVHNDKGCLLNVMFGMGMVIDYIQQTVKAGVKEGVDVLEVLTKGHPVTTEEVSMKWGNKGNTWKSISNEKTHKDACTNNI